MVNLLHLTHTNLAANPKNGIFQIRNWVSGILGLPKIRSTPPTNRQMTDLFVTAVYLKWCDFIQVAFPSIKENIRYHHRPNQIN